MMKNMSRPCQDTKKKVSSFRPKKMMICSVLGPISSFLESQKVPRSLGENLFSIKVEAKDVFGQTPN